MRCHYYPATTTYSLYTSRPYIYNSSSTYVLLLHTESHLRQVRMMQLPALLKITAAYPSAPTAACCLDLAGRHSRGYATCWHECQRFRPCPVSRLLACGLLGACVSANLRPLRVMWSPPPNLSGLVHTKQTLACVESSNWPTNCRNIQYQSNNNR